MALLRACLLGLAMASMLFLSACVNKEPQERAAFIQLLQSRMNSASLLPIGSLSEPEKEAIGGYADAYEVIADFQEILTQAAASMRDASEAETLRSVADIVERRDRLEAARKTLAEQAAEVQRAQAKADKARAALALPADLAPVAEVLDAAAAMDAVARDALGVADFVAAHAQDILLTDGQARVATPTLQQELNLRLQGLNAQSDVLEHARAVLRQAAGQPQDAR